ncbi:MAG TPA: replicative DNA helicase [Flavobacteriales bacterium]|nr:replicative DNA helicase [Flavobacteriales bacterium]HIO66721.1 replicative DNA helicase [Flavobacteriales bacterium]
MAPIGVANLEHGKLPPQALELEEAVLGALMLEKDALTDVIDKLKPENFYKEVHQKIYQAICDLFSKSEPTDYLTVINELKRNGDLEVVGGPYYITQLTAKIASTANTEFHAHIILQKFIQRELIRISSGVIEEAYDDTIDVFDLLDNAESKLFEVAEGTIRGAPKKMTGLISQVLKRIEEAKNHKDGMSGVASGFTRLDRLTNGWQKADLIIVAARPAMGKTAFVLSMARNLAVEFRKPVAFFSLEMSSLQLVMRLISNETELDAEKLKRGQLTMAEWEQLHAQIDKLSDAPLIIDDTPALSVFELRAKSRKLMVKHQLELIVVDYLQLMTTGTEGKGNREQEISLISRSLKSIAKELNVPIIALSQLSRAVETRGGDKRPMLSDLRESGAIEQDADIVIFLYRPEYYGIDEDDAQNPTNGIAEVIISKHRNGQTGTVKLKFIDRLAKFKSLDEFETFDGSHNPYGSEPKTYTAPSKMNDEDEGEGDGPPPF